ncbi:MAG: hypothetical protein HY905_00890 [Deltaproteobacteria bacterium]|nr:hypothetical protein [Deltaproteobacteria bacterium]
MPRPLITCSILALVALATACRKAPPPGPPKEDAQAILRGVLQALERQDYDDAMSRFHVPSTLHADEAKEALAGFLARGEISGPGLDVLFEHGRWGRLADLVGRDKASRFAERVQLPVDALWGYFGPDEKGQAIFLWGTKLELVRIDDIGSLGPPPSPPAPPSPSPEPDPLSPSPDQQPTTNNQQPTPPADRPDDGVVRPDLVADWVAADAPRTYLPDDLHLLVDGGDDVFLRYGFVWAERRTYRPTQPANRRVRVEAYAFSSPAGALGRYDHDSAEGAGAPWSADPPPPELSGKVDAARLDADQLRLARGRFLAILHYEDDAETDVPTLIAAARAPLLAFAAALGETLGGMKPPMDTDEHR